MGGCWEWGRGWVEARRDGGGNGRFANRPYQMVVRGNEGWVPAPRLHGSKISTRGQREGVNSCLRLHGSKISTQGQREGVESCLRLYGGGLCVGRTGTGMGPRMREDNGRGWIPDRVFTGVALRGRMGTGVDSCLRFHGGGTSAGMTDGMGPRMREDKGRGWIPACVFTGVGPVRG